MQLWKQYPPFIMREMSILENNANILLILICNYKRYCIKIKYIIKFCLIKGKKVNYPYFEMKLETVNDYDNIEIDK